MSPSLPIWPNSSNCPQHIPQRLEATEVKGMPAERDERIEDLPKELTGYARFEAQTTDGATSLSRLLTNIP